MLATLNKKLAFAAFSVALLAMLSSLLAPAHSGDNKLDSPSYITVLELAENIKNRDDLTLIDVRSREAFQKFKIPSAVHIPITQLIKQPFDPAQRLIFYSGDDSLALQAYYVAKGMGIRNTSILKGGVYDWYEYILHPKMPVNVAKEDRELARHIKELCAFYGGRPDFVSNGNPLKYYKENGTSDHPTQKRTGEIVRMGC